MNILLALTPHLNMNVQAHTYINTYIFIDRHSHSLVFLGGHIKIPALIGLRIFCKFLHTNCSLATNQLRQFCNSDFVC